MTARVGSRRRLGELLLDAGVLDATRLQAALAEQKKWGGKLGRTLVEMGFVDEAAMVRALSRQLKLPVVDLDLVALPPTVTQILTVDVCERYGVFPLGLDVKGKKLQLATSDPTNVTALNEIAFKTDLTVQTAVATGSSIDRAIRRMYYGEQTTASATATPQQLGIAEADFDEDEISGVREAPSGTLANPAVSQPIVDPIAEIESAARDAELTRLRDRLAALEKKCDGQARALQGLLELLIEAGLVSRDEYLAKIARPD